MRVYLKRVTITGFKSFANKTVLDLEPGITAVVGPNGSGKSNFADAIRWAFGEQSKGRLRLGDREDVVFAGTDKRARASYAEVILLFDNEDGAFPLDLTEVEISRRLYRSGESDYRLAGRSVRLSDIQALLAQGGVGAGTYAVIGQGMIDSFLLSSPSERKLLFDEAAGIRGAEVSREQAMRKLDATATNLTRLRDISAELAPRLELLQQAVAASRVQHEMEGKVAKLRDDVAAARHAGAAALVATLESREGELTRDLDAARLEERRLVKELKELESDAAKSAAARERLQVTLSKLESDRDRLALELAETRSAVADAERASDAVKDLGTQLKEAQQELKDAEARTAELTAQALSNAQMADRALKAVEHASKEVAAAQSALVALRRRSADGTRDQYVDHALQILKTMAVSMGKNQLNMDEVKILVHKAGRLLSHASKDGAAELLTELKAAQKNLESAMAKRETAIEHQTNITITGRSLEIDSAHQHDATERARRHVDSIEDQLAPHVSAARDTAGLKAKLAKLTSTLETATAKLDTQREAIRDLAGPTDDPAGLARAMSAADRARAAVTSTSEALAATSAELKTARAALRGAGPAPSHAAPKTPLPELIDQLARAEASLEAHAAVVRDQATEYEAVQDRTTELTTQIADLEVAQADLERVIAELDEQIRLRFKANFAKLADQFSAYFHRLFDGGTATLELAETPDGYGINIKASPKGKRLSSITSLSGGERALAGVALLAAILRVNPSPFVVLDEIDAALDEANSGRLAGILEELQEQSQLIVITHNRQTMRAARVLFGVTINEHHVSHLLSMRLEEAAQMAAR
jgi:chromosome segregation protein